ncbi:MAG: DUF6044 family protein [Clostridia bacterium]|nr:DUF6044 family protein [Clostridia bacterium]
MTNKKISPKALSLFVFLIGFVAVIGLYLPTVLLGENALIPYDDQLDGEVLAYMMNAKHLFGGTVPELFSESNSISSLTPPAFFPVLLYKVFSPFAAFMINYLLVAFTAYVGMYLCIKEITGNDFIACITAVIFSILPFYSVYGLSVMGQPLVLYAFLLLINNKKAWPAYVITAFFAMYSSLVLVGFADVAILGAAAVVLLIMKKPQWKKVAIMTGILTVVYLAVNYRLIADVFLSTVVSHKTEIAITASSSTVADSFWNLLKNGQFHAASVHIYVYYFTLIVLGIMIAAGKSIKKVSSRSRFIMYGFSAAAVLIAAAYAVYHSTKFLSVRRLLGGVLKSFQVDRVYWLYPMIWFVLLGVGLYVVYSFFEGKIGKTLMCVLVSVLVFNSVYTGSNIRINNLKSEGKVGSVYRWSSWKEFYAEDMFSEIRDYIGKDQSEYRVASVGLYPSIALYNGFYCIDGYSNNYDVEYKHKFREIIGDELERNEKNRSYYDEWGNRCYILSSELPCREYLITKGSGYHLKELSLDYSVMRELGCEYIFSALPIENESAFDYIEFCKRFESEDCKYEVYLYKISDSVADAG